MPYLDFTTDNFFHIFTKLLKDDKPCWISRLGGSDYIAYEHIYEKGFDRDSRSALENIRKYNGFFDKSCVSSPPIFGKSAIIYLDSINNSDLTLLVAMPEDQAINRLYTNNLNKKFIKEMDLYHKQVSYYSFIESVEPFLKSFKIWGEGKKILVISPFEDTIKFQTSGNRLNNLLNGYEFPKCEFKTYRTPITYNSSDWQSNYFNKVTENHDNWIELSKQMLDDISSIDFDIAFISAGLYSMFLGHRIKTELKKKSIYIGGMLNVLFNFYGSRYDTSFFRKFKNLQYEIDPLDDFGDLLSNNSNNRYDVSEGLNAYFRGRPHGL
tara:strand:- start:562 stop:1533 length:972 start_codon:yes stop_codon:yes gene_type:complete